MICPECLKDSKCPTCGTGHVLPIYRGDGPGDPGGVPTGEYICRWCGHQWEWKCSECESIKINKDEKGRVFCKSCGFVIQDPDPSIVQFECIGVVSEDNTEMSEEAYEKYLQEMNEGKWNPSEFINFVDLDRLRNEVLKRGYDLHSIGCPREYDYDQPIKQWPGSDQSSGCPSPVNSCCLISASLYLDWELELEAADKVLEEWDGVHYPFGAGNDEFVCHGCGTKWKKRYNTWNEVKP